MAYGYRCEAGCASWPDHEDYKTCFVCGGPCSRYRNLSPLDEKEAMALRFEVYYEQQHEPDLTLTPSEEALVEKSRERGVEEHRARRREGGSAGPIGGCRPPADDGIGALDAPTLRPGS